VVLLTSVWVPGIPRPKGSLTPQQVRAGDGKLTGRTRLVDSDPSKRWRRKMAVEFGKYRGPTFAGPVIVTACFFFARCCNDNIWAEPHIGDLDKLLRNVYDALQDAAVYGNDRQVVSDGGSTKKLAIAPWHGAQIVVTSAEGIE
jgi:Holliday junction resolvase RusA-like endonuclease